MVRRQHLRAGTRKLLHMALVPAPLQRPRVSGQVAEMLGKKTQTSLDIFLEVEDMELEYKWHGAKLLPN